MNQSIIVSAKKAGKFLLILILFAACSNDELIQRTDSLDAAFNKASDLYEQGDYRRAARAFETIIQMGRGTDYGREAQYYLAESYHNDGRFLLAASEYERHATLFPRSERREEVDFKEALSYYHLSPRYKLDQQYTRRAIDRFRLFNSRYPNSDRVDEARKYISELRSKLARKLFSSAQLYMRTDQYEAAIVYYDLTIDNYPESPWAERALVNKINAYVIYADNSIRERQPERYHGAVEAYETYVQLFPNGENRAKAEEYIDEAREALSEFDEEEIANSDVQNSSN